MKNNGYLHSQQAKATGGLLRFMCLRGFVHCYFLLFLLLTEANDQLLANVTSGTGSIDFDIDNNQSSEVKLNSTGLAIGSNLSPSAKLHVGGNAIVTKSLSVGSATAGSSNLNVSGSWGMSFESVSDNTTIGTHTMVLVDSSAGNITVRLPVAATVSGHQYRIKKTSDQNSVAVWGSDNIEGLQGMALGSGNFGAVTLISTNGEWHITSIFGTRGVPSLVTLFEDTFSDSNTKGNWVEMVNGATVFDYGAAGVATIVDGGDGNPSSLWHNFTDSVLVDGGTLTVSFDVMMSRATAVGAHIRFGLGYSSAALTDGNNSTTPVDGYMSSAPFLGDNGDPVNYWLDGDPAGINWGNAATVFYSNGALDDNDNYSVTNSGMRPIQYRISRSGNDFSGSTYVNGAWSTPVMYTDTITDFKFNAFGFMAPYNAGETYTYDNVKVVLTQ